eukprot:1597928-Rhodomonas_salina.3
MFTAQPLTAPPLASTRHASSRLNVAVYPLPQRNLPHTHTHTHTTYTASASLSTHPPFSLLSLPPLFPPQPSTPRTLPNLSHAASGWLADLGRDAAGEGGGFEGVLKSRRPAALQALLKSHAATPVSTLAASPP